MSLIVSCSKCGKKYKVGDDKAGKKIKCTGCNSIILIPSRGAIEVLPAEEADPWDLAPPDDSDADSQLGLPPRAGSRTAAPRPSRPSKRGGGIPTWIKVLLIVFSGLGGITLLACGGCYFVAKKVETNVREQAKEATRDFHSKTLTEARTGFQTKLLRRETSKGAVVDAPTNVFRTVRYEATAGQLAAYVSPDPQDGKKHPAIIWIAGGDCNSLGNVWKEAEASNDQTAAAYRKAGIVMMFPSLRGGDGNPGVKEGFFGEVDDVLAAATFLAKESYVDPDRIYLGGHSTGGTLALLVAESTDRFRAVFSFGPAHDVSGYGAEYLPFDMSNPKEIQYRSPGRWLGMVQSPTFVLEGTDQGNIESLQAMDQSSTNSKVRFFAVLGASHFNILAPANRLIAQKILRDEGPVSDLKFSAEELNSLFSQ